MANYLDGMTGFEVVGGSAGASSPWSNQGGAFQSVAASPFATPDYLKGITADTFIGAGVAGGTNPEGIGTPLDPSKQSFLNSGNVDLGAGLRGANDWINEYFVRGVVIILGFIFVAAGLATMGHSDTAINVLMKAAK